ncbi:MAG: PAS domain-containing protein, partial [Planctomycetaceae bacterium]|nr:PAS domain-containing protein [Planctomycetaceae bacterium]
WAKLNRGESVISEFRRIGNGGKEIWIQASYNPITDLSGKIFKVVEYASDITTQVNDISNTIASAVEEQTATANEMSRNISKRQRERRKSLRTLHPSLRLQKARLREPPIVSRLPAKCQKWPTNFRNLVLEMASGTKPT